MIRTLFYVLALIPALVNANEKIDDQVVFISEQDKAMNAAIDTARETLNDFFKVAERPPKEASDFKLKVMISDENGVEHLWFSPFKEIEGGFAGVLLNEPNIVTSMNYGKVYAFRENQITDWGYVLNGKQVGSYTVCALFKTMDKAVVAQYKADHGFECDS